MLLECKYCVVVSGGRDFSNWEFLSKKLDEIFMSEVFGESSPMIIVGDARGADAMAARYAAKRNIPVKVCRANWKEYPKTAGFILNQEMLAQATHLIAFWNGKSRGTQHIIALAQRKGIPCRVFHYTN